jgi:putative tricarboxylic transport membrane protein
MCFLYQEAGMKLKQFLNKDIVSGIALILFAFFVIFETRGFQSAAERFRGVSPALFPTILSIGIILLSLTMILRGIRKGYNWRFTIDFHKKNSYVAISLIVGTAIYGLTIDFLGFFLVTSIYTLVFIILMKGASPSKAIVIALASVGLIYFVFHSLMFVPFPRGEIMELIGL